MKTMKVFAIVKKYISYLKGKQNPQTKYRLFLKSRGTASAEDVIKEAAGHCDIKPMKLREAMEALGEAITHFIQMGFDVRVPGLGNVCLQLRSKEVDTPEECTRETFKNEANPINVTILPTEGLKDAVKGIELHVLKYGQTSEEDEDTTNGGGSTNSGGGTQNSQNGGGTNNGGGSQNNGGGTNTGGGGTTNVEKYTITYSHNNATYTTQEWEVGAAVTAPAAPDGYIWLNVPSVMPSRNVTCESYEAGDPNDI